MRAATIDELASNPVGRYLVGQTWVHFCLEAKLWGVLLWGRPTEADAVALGRSLVLELAPPAEPHVSIVDASRLEGGDEGAFGALERYVAKHGDRLAKWVTRLALVRPDGLRGAIVAGAYEVMDKPYPVALFDDPALALEWLGVGGLTAAFSEMAASALGTAPLLSALRGYLDSHLETANLREAAHALGVSDRSLQRKLGELETGFQAELADARVRSAQRRLLDADAALTTIALEVGCASLQHFNTLFRRRSGVTPSVWRDQERARRGQT